MIVALDSTPLTVPTGGIARYTLELTRALAREYPEDRYWLLSDQEISIDDQSQPSNVFVGSRPTNIADRRWWLWGLNREMQRHGVELFHGTDFSVPYMSRRPSVMTIHDLSPWREDVGWQPAADRIRKRTPRLLRLGLATMVITPSEAIRREVMERFEVAGDRVVAVPLAASDYFRPAKAGDKSARSYFLFVGTLEPRKNVERMIEAWRECRKQYEVDLVIAGRLRSDFAAPPPESGLGLIGAVPDADLPGLYSNAVACVYPSLYEGFGLPVLEAMQCGAVVITSRDPAIVEVTGGGDCAIHVDATDVRQLTEAMCAIAAGPERFEELRARALHRAAQFSWSATARHTREVYVEATRRTKA
ncbi:MAG: glycosyltransferase family 1 protein [Acidobacteriota bacterium]